MNAWFEWNGVRSTSYGVIVSEFPPITVPKERTSTVNVPGRSGSLTLTEGTDIYDDLTLSVKCFIKDASKIGDIAAWLRGKGTLKLGNRPEGYYIARVSNQIPFDKILRGSPNRSVTIQFKCNPFFYLDRGIKIKLSESGKTIENRNGFTAYPIYEITGSGAISFSVNGISIGIENASGTVYVDAEGMWAYKYVDGEPVSVSPSVTLVDEEWPVLEPGSNVVTWSGSVSEFVVQPNWRCL